MKRIGWLLWLLGLAGCSTPGASLKELVVRVDPGGQVRVSYDGRGETCPAGQSCIYRLSPGSGARLEAQPSSDFFFAGWSGDCSGFGACQLVLSENRRVEARFEALVGGFNLGPLPDPLVVPAGAQVELGVRLERQGGFNPPPAALEVQLIGQLVGGAVDQVSYRYLPEKSGLERLVLELKGPEPAEVWTYLAAPARLSVRVGGLERSLEFTLATAPCLAGCGR